MSFYIFNEAEIEVQKGERTFSKPHSKPFFVVRVAEETVCSNLKMFWAAVLVKNFCQQF